MKVLVYIVALKVFYDFSIHLIFLLNKQEFFMKRHLNYWPEWQDKSISKKRYQQFWSTYWAVALVLLLAYFLT